MVRMAQRELAGGTFYSRMVVLLGLIIGLPVVVVLAAPAYALLLRAGRASFPAAAAIGAAPGLAMLLLTRELAVPALVTGLAVGLTTHWVCRVRPNNSFKPTPCRGVGHVLLRYACTCPPPRHGSA